MGLNATCKILCICWGICLPLFHGNWIALWKYESSLFREMSSVSSALEEMRDCKDLESSLHFCLQFTKTSTGETRSLQSCASVLEGKMIKREGLFGFLGYFGWICISQGVLLSTLGFGTWTVVYHLSPYTSSSPSVLLIVSVLFRSEHFSLLTRYL